MARPGGEPASRAMVDLTTRTARRRSNDQIPFCTGAALITHKLAVGMSCPFQLLRSRIHVFPHISPKKPCTQFHVAELIGGGTMDELPVLCSVQV